MEVVVVNNDVVSMHDDDLDSIKPQKVHKEQAFVNTDFNAGDTANYLLTYNWTEWDWHLLRDPIHDPEKYI